MILGERKLYILKFNFETLRPCFKDIKQLISLCSELLTWSKGVNYKILVMSLIPGKYQHYKNENIEDIFAAAGAPYIARKAINMASPLIEISINGDTMTLIEKTLIFKLENTFKIGEQYEEHMPTKSLKSVTTIINDHEMLTTVMDPTSGDKFARHYEFTQEECVVTLSHEKVNTAGKRYFHRIKD